MERKYANTFTIMGQEMMHRSFTSAIKNGLSENSALSARVCNLAFSYVHLKLLFTEWGEKGRGMLR